MIDADLDIKIGVQSRLRIDSERFRPTIMYTSDWHWENKLSDYSGNTSMYALEVYNYVQDELTKGAVVQVHGAVRMSNPTHPAVGAGVVPLAKGHHDFAFTSEELTSDAVLRTKLDDVIVGLQTGAKY